MKSIKIDDPRDFKQKLLWCFFWTNRKAIRTEGCAPFIFEKISTGETTYSSQPGKLLSLSTDILQDIGEDMEGGKTVEFTIKMGAETFDMAFLNNVFSVVTKRNKDIETEIIECLNDELKKGKPKICPSFPQRVGIDTQK